METKNHSASANQQRDMLFSAEITWKQQEDKFPFRKTSCKTLNKWDSRIKWILNKTTQTYPTKKADFQSVLLIGKFGRSHDRLKTAKW